MKQMLWIAALVALLFIWDRCAADGLYAQIGTGVIAQTELQVGRHTRAENVDVGRHTAFIGGIGYRRGVIDAGWLHVSSIETDSDPGLDLIYFRVILD